MQASAAVGLGGAARALHAASSARAAARARRKKFASRIKLIHQQLCAAELAENQAARLCQ